jgi:esterase/lipase superfamily enzyme
LGNFFAQGDAMNFVFLPPHFPPNFPQFASQLKAQGIAALGLAEPSPQPLHRRLHGRKRLFQYPARFPSNLTDEWYLDLYRQSRIIACAGQGAWEDEMLADTRALEDILKQKDIPHWIDIWGGDVNHDWPWRHKMLPYFLDKLQFPGYYTVK